MTLLNPRIILRVYGSGRHILSSSYPRARERVEGWGGMHFINPSAKDKWALNVSRTASLAAVHDLPESSQTFRLRQTVRELRGLSQFKIKILITIEFFLFFFFCTCETILDMICFTFL